jgi:sugar transferase (PEP-CTERM system associated)
MMRLFKVFFPTSVLALIISEALLIFGCYIAATYILISVEASTYLLYEGGLGRIAVVVALIMIGLYFSDLYTTVRIQSRIALLQQICMVLGAAFLAQAVISYVNRGWTLPRWLMIIGSSFALVGISLWRMAFSRLWAAIGKQKILFLGASPTMFELAKHIEEHPELGFAVTGYLDEDPSSAGSADPAVRRLGCLEDIRTVSSSIQPDRVVVAMRERRQKLPVNELLEMRFSGIQTEEAVHLYEATFGRICSREIRPSHLIFSTELGPRKHSVQMQTLYSTSIAVVATVVTLPIMALVAILVKVSSPGPILLRQKRVGLHDEPFTVLKFRSMYRDAEARTGAIWAAKNDPRITPLGRWLRLLRLDELPQLFNVLRGEMSIVGPRPERPEFVTMLSEQIPFYRQRHYVKPGITGWAQINYKYGDTIEDTIVKLEYDLYYIKHLSPMLDLYILFNTLKTMLLFRGAQ